MNSKITYDLNRGMHSSKKWTSLLEQLDKPDNSVDKIADKFAEQLSIDKKCLELNLEVSDCALFCPMLKSNYDKSHGICSLIASKLFESDIDEESADFENDLVVCDKFTKLVKKLRSTYKTNYDNYKKLDTMYKRVVNLNNRNDYAYLASLPLTKHILEPEAMPVTDSDDLMFDPIIEYVKSNVSIETKTFEKGTVFSDGRLDLCRQGLTIVSLTRILEAVKSNTQIQHLLIGNNILGDEGVGLIAEFIKNSAHIKTLYICACDITEIGLKLICDVLKTDNVVESLWLKRNPLKTEGSVHLAEMLRVNKTIHTIDVFNTGLLDEGCKNIFEALEHNSTLKTLYIGANGVTVEGSKSIANYFITKKDNLLTTLFLDVNRIGDEGTKLLCQSLKGRGLRSLNLGANRLTHQAMKEITDCFVDDKDLQVLDVGMCKATLNVHELPNNISDEGVESILRLITFNNNLRVLNIRHNAISEEGINKILEALKLNKNLYKLNIEQSGNKNVNESIKLSSEYLEGNFEDKSNLHSAIRSITHGNSEFFTESIYLSNF